MLLDRKHSTELCNQAESLLQRLKLTGQTLATDNDVFGKHHDVQETRKEEKIRWQIDLHTHGNWHNNWQDCNITTF
jgi:hypothetical protein